VFPSGSILPENFSSVVYIKTLFQYKLSRGVYTGVRPGGGGLVILSF